MEVVFQCLPRVTLNPCKPITRKIKNSRVCSLVRGVDRDIKVAAKVMRAAAAFRIHVFLATSTLHVEFKLNKEL